LITVVAPRNNASDQQILEFEVPGEVTVEAEGRKLLAREQLNAESSFPRAVLPRA